MGKRAKRGNTMHTIICTFDDKTRAREAVDALVRAGFARGDLHIEHKRSADEAEANDNWDSMEREVAVDPHVVTSFGHFFARLFGHDHLSGHGDRYTRHVERGSHVVVADTKDAAEAERARSVLHGMQATDLNVVHRAEQRPMRDILGLREDGKTGMFERSRDVVQGTTTSPIERERDRAVASNAVKPTAGPDLRDAELDHAPGLRYSDKDKPL
jgi:hypothetical protein